MYLFHPRLLISNKQAISKCITKMSSTIVPKQPVPPFTLETAIQKVRLAEGTALYIYNIHELFSL